MINVIWIKTIIEPVPARLNTAIPTPVVRGDDPYILSSITLQKMRTRLSGYIRTIEVVESGHVPTLDEA